MNTQLKPFLIIISILSLMLTISAQNEIDALRFSETDWQGTARFMGAGRAFGAVGAEFSALSTNPASIGVYKRSDVTFTPMTISVYKNTSGYNGSATLAQNVKYNIGSAGIVLTMNGISSTLWKNFQVGYGFNRIQNYNNIFSIEGRNQGATIGSAFAESAFGLNANDPNKVHWDAEPWIAWRSYLIEPVDGRPTEYFPLLAGVDMKQTSTVARSGGNDEMIFSFGSNYDDKLFLGATLGVPFVNFTENRTFREVNDKNADFYEFQNITITDKLNVRAAGINLKLGVIYQPLDFLRIGAAFHTPTYYGNVRDFFERRMSADFFEWDSELKREVFRTAEDSYTNNFNYSLTTPLRAMANVVFLIQQRAFISAEYEFTDYSMANMYSVSYSFSDENKATQNLYGFSHIARIGAEFAVNQIFSIRAGYNYISSPYKEEITDDLGNRITSPHRVDSYNGSKHYASAGFGFRTRIFYSDFAYAFTTSKEKYWMFDSRFVNAANNRFITHRIMLTMGVRF